MARSVSSPARTSRRSSQPPVRASVCSWSALTSQGSRTGRSWEGTTTAIWGTRGLSCAALNDARPDLSILMPVFNEEDTVETAIERVLEADLPVERLELVVVENGSTDRTREVLAARRWPDAARVLQA